MNPVDLVTALIVAGLVIVCLGITVFALWERNGDHKREALKGWRVVAELREERDDLRHERVKLNEYAANQRDRADRMLSQIYDLRQQMGLAPRAHTECVDAWADGRAPCEKCAELLPGARRG